jgi:hypothetical protein
VFTGQAVTLEGTFYSIGYYVLPIGVIVYGLRKAWVFFRNIL